ncbi:MAG TPA: hypothetical protein VLV32_08485 [Burkholderiales bacterium]|nr:hypothetical protein [Burkholderiales bacterium]
MSAAFQTTVTISGDAKSLDAFKREIGALLAKEDDVQGLQEQYISPDVVYRFEVNRGIPFPAFVTTSQIFPDLTIKLQWINHRDAVSGSAVIQNGKVTEQQVRPLEDSERAGSQMQLDIEVEENGYLRHAIALMKIRVGEYAGYVVTGEHHAFFRISKNNDQIELFSSDGLEAEWTERWNFESESVANDYRELAPGEKIDEPLYQRLQALASDFLDDWVWFSESPIEDIIIEQQKYGRMGLVAHRANIKAEKIRKMEKSEIGRKSYYRLSTLSSDCAWIKTAIAACWELPNQA